MSPICLDTSAYSHFKRGDQEVARIIGSAREVLVPSVVLGELHVGFRLGTKRERNVEELDEFLGHELVDVISVDAAVAQHYADIVVELRKAGTPIPTNDIWIAASAASRGATVVTYDDHFARIARVASRVLGSDL